MAVPDSSIQYKIALELGAVCEDLHRGAWSTYPFATAYNLEHDARLEGKYGHYGKDEHLVSKYEHTPDKKRDFSNGIFALQQKRPNIHASFLTPTNVSLKNPDKKTKQITLAFHEKFFEKESENKSAHTKRKNFSTASTAHNLRESDFDTVVKYDQHGNPVDTIKTDFLKKIRAKIVKTMQATKDEVPPPKIKLTFAGEGLSGLDAQLMFQNVLADLCQDQSSIINHPGQNLNLKNINLELELVTIDTVKATEKNAQQTAHYLEILHEKFPNITVKGYDLSHKRSQERLGQCHLFSEVNNPEHALVVKEHYSAEGDIKAHYNNREPEKADKLRKQFTNSGFMAFLYRRNLTLILHDGLSFARNTFNRFIVDNLKKILPKPQLQKPQAITPPMPISEPKRADAHEPASAAQVSEDKIEPALPLDAISKINKKITDLAHETHQLEEASSEENRRRFVNPKGNPPIENLVFEGGGVKGLVYAGALNKMQVHDLYKDVKRVAGSSAGGIVACLLASGYHPDEIEPIMKELDFTSMMDSAGDKIAFTPLGRKLIDFYQLVTKKGIYKGEAFLKLQGGLIIKGIEKRLSEQFEKDYLKQSNPQKNDESDNDYQIRLEGIEKKLSSEEKTLQKDFIQIKINNILENFGITDFSDITYAQLEQLRVEYPAASFKSLYHTATNMENGSLAIFSHEHSPHMKILHGTRATMGFPGAFVPLEIDGKPYADGGIANNFPMNIFDEQRFLPEGFSFNDVGANPGTLGFLVDSAAEIRERWGIKDETAFKNLSLPAYFGNLLTGLHSRMDDLKERYTTNAIQIFDEDVATMNFELTEDEKRRLVLSGEKSFEFYALQYRHRDIAFDAQYFATLEEKYATLDTDAILHVKQNELAPLYNQAKELKVKYDIHLNEYRTLLQAAKAVHQKLTDLRDQQLDAIDQPSPQQQQFIHAAWSKQIETAHASIERLSHEIDLFAAMPELLHGRAQQLEKELALVNDVLKDKGIDHTFDATEPLLQSQPVADFNAEHPYNRDSFLALQALNAAQYPALEVTEQSHAFKLEPNHADTAVSFTNIDDEKTRCTIKRLPRDNEKMRKILTETYDKVFQSIINKEENKKIELAINSGSSQQSQLFAEVVNVLKQKYQTELNQKGLQIQLKAPEIAAAPSPTRRNRNPRSSH